MDPIAGEKYQQMLHAGKALVLQYNRSSLSYYHELGRLGTKIQKAYGTAAVARFCGDLQAALGVGGFSEANVYKAIQFYKTTSDKQLQVLMKTGVSWRHITNLSRAAVSQEARAEIITLLDAGHLKPAQIAERLSQQTQEAYPIEKPKAISAAIRQDTDHYLLNLQEKVHISRRDLLLGEILTAIHAEDADGKLFEGVKSLGGLRARIQTLLRQGLAATVIN